MHSVFIYICIVFFSTLSVYLSDYTRNTFVSRTLFAISFIIVFIPSAIRYGVGTDFYSYVFIYEYIDESRKGEYVFHFLNELLRFFSLSSSWAIAAYAFIFTFIAYKSYPKERKWLFHFLFVTMLLFSSFNLIRQSIAISLTMLSLRLIIEGKDARSFYLLILALLFHQSAIFMIFAVALSRIPAAGVFKYRFFPALVIVFSILVWVGPSFIGFIEMLANKLSLPYLRYFESEYFEKLRIGSGYLVLFKVLVILALIARSKALLAISEKYWIIIICTGFYAVIYSLSSQSAVFGRMSAVFIPGVIYFIYLWVLYFFKKNIFNYLICVAAIILYSFSYFAAALASNDPYSDNHYRTVFSREL